MAKPVHTPIPRYRAHRGPAILAHGFRPFFLLAGVWAVVALAVSFEMLHGRLRLPTAFDALAWHYHELLFGYAAAAIAGFLLTAIPNWTGRLPLQGMPLLGLVLLWLAGRAGLAASQVIGPWSAAVLDLSFLLALAAVAWREIVAGRNWRNLPMVVAVVLLLLANALSHAEALGAVDTAGLAHRSAIAVLIALIALVGGRVIPSFTRNWLVKRGAAGVPAAFGTFDKLALLVTAVALVAWAAAPDRAVTAGLVAVAAALNLARLARWRGYAAYPEPLLLVLHVGYLWIPAGLAMLAVSHWWPALPPTGALHALTVGAVGTMTLAVMTRAILGHTGRALHAGGGLRAVFVLVTLAALLRVAASLAATAYAPVLTAAAVAWIAAFVVYLAVCGPMLVTHAPRGQGG